MMQERKPLGEMWRQIGGDVSPMTYGCTLARREGDEIYILEIQPVREHVGDKEAAEVGFPYWSREAYFTVEELASHPQADGARKYIGMSVEDWAELPLEHKAEALAQYGCADEGDAGWAADVLPGPVEWWQADSSATFADEDTAFRHDILDDHSMCDDCGDDDTADDCQEEETVVD